jgi:protein-tyrosine-phosphatase
MTARILFLCAQGSHRALLAASLLHAKYAAQWEAWSTPPLLLQHTLQQQVVEQVLQEQGLSLLPADRLIQPSFGQQWEQGIVLCSGGTVT